jgi:energy-coupling factor transporter ATP-binding protein EcfA2
MPLKSIFIKNFRGISDGVTLPIRPITLFIGANSSGKSTVIHSLATLSQTVKLPNDSRPLILDDELGSVHLGRFIEVIHSKSYKDCISLGLNFSDADIPRPTDKELQITKGTVGMCLDFKSTTRTQKVFVEKGEITVDNEKFHFERKPGGIKEILPKYGVEKVGSGKSATVHIRTGFLLEEKERSLKLGGRLSWRRGIFISS